MWMLPFRLTVEERRDLVRRLAERLGTGTAGGLSLLAEHVAGTPPGVARLALEGTAGVVKVRGIQETGPAAAGGGALYQRDRIGISGLPDGLGVVLEVEAGALPESAPAPVELEFREGPAEARATALDEAYRFLGERFAASLVKKAATARALPLGPLDEADLKKWVRGRWRAPAPFLAADAAGSPPAHLAGLAAVEAPAARAGEHLILRTAHGPERAAAAIAIVPNDGLVTGFELARGSDALTLERALAFLAKEPPTDPRPTRMPWSEAGSASLETPAFVAGFPGRASGAIREPASGHGLRLGAIDLELVAAGGGPRGQLTERHLHGLAGGGFAFLASFPQEGRTTALLAGPRELLPKWVERLRKGLE